LGTPQKKKSKDQRRERWYHVEDYEGFYQVSTFGRVRSLARIDNRGRRLPMKVLRTLAKANGRRHAHLSKEGVSRSLCVSVLMAQAYAIQNPRGCSFVVHRNRDQSDFRRGNLAWVTLAELRIHDGHKVSSRYYGVHRARGLRRGGTLSWIARIMIKRRAREIGYFATPQEAAYAYDCEVKRLRLSRPLNGLAKPAARLPKIASLPGEVWRRFVGAEQTHMISNRGRVRTLAYRTQRGTRVLPKLRKITVSASGHRSILIGGRRYGISASIARAFARARRRQSVASTRTAAVTLRIRP